MTIPVPADDTPRIYVRDETDVRVLIMALSLYSAHTHSEDIAKHAEELGELLMQQPRGLGYASRNAPTITGAAIPERS